MTRYLPVSMPRSLFVLSLAAALAACGPDPAATPPPPPPPDDGEEPPTEPPATGEPRTRVVYVPAYSHLPSARGETLFAITLSVRNVDPSTTITLTHVDYYDTSGHRVRGYLRERRELAPLETAEFSVETFDEAGGSGANFLVYWEAPSDAHPLLTETVMLGHVGSAYVAFTSRGVELQRPPTALPVAEPEPEP